MRTIGYYRRQALAHRRELTMLRRSHLERLGMAEQPTVGAVREKAPGPHGCRGRLSQMG